MKFKDFILDTNLSNNLYIKGPDGYFTNKEVKGVETKDKIFLTSFYDKKKLGQTSVTDYAIANGAFPSKNGNIDYILRSQYNSNCVYCVKRDGKREEADNCTPTVGLRPEINLSLDVIYKLHKDIDENKNGNRVLKFGLFPNSRAYDSEALEEIFKTNSGLFKETGKSYTGYYDKNKDTFTKNKEYVYEGKTYVRVKIKRNKKPCFNDNTPVAESGNYVWMNVKPIIWKVTNWDDIVNGKAQLINVISEQIIMCGIPFNKTEQNFSSFPNNNKYNTSLWQNSTARGYLNGKNVENIKENGYLEFAQSGCGDFSNNGFLDEAFDLEINKNLYLDDEYEMI